MTQGARAETEAAWPCLLGKMVKSCVVLGKIRLSRIVSLIDLALLKAPFLFSPLKSSDIPHVHCFQSSFMIFSPGHC